MGQYQPKRKFRSQSQRRKRPPRRMAGCGHYVYAWRDVERCSDCLREHGDLYVESLREFRRRLWGSGS